MCYNTRIPIDRKEMPFMSIVYQKDKRSGITYAYESKAFWDKEKHQSRSKRTLIGRVNPDTGEIVPTDGRCRKNSPYQKPEKTEADEVVERIKPMKLSELRREVVRLESELKEARKQIEQLKAHKI